MTMDAELEARITAYSIPLPVPNRWAMPRPAGTASTPMATARAMPARIPLRRSSERSGTCEPATNITSANPTPSPRNLNVGSSAFSSPSPVAPSATPTASSPITTGIRMNRCIDNTGPSIATPQMRARWAKFISPSQAR